MPQVHTRMQPDVPIEVDDAEAAVLAACGLLAPDPAPAPALPAVVPAATPAPKTPADQPPAKAPAPPTTDASEADAEATTKKKG